MIGTITLNPSIDQHLIVEHLVKDDANRAKAVLRYAGGKGVNVSKVIRELGGQTRAYAPVGGLPGALWKQLVEKLDIPYSTVPVQGDTRINTILTDLKDRTQTRISAPGPQLSEQEHRAFNRKLLSIRPKPDFWALGGSLPLGMGPSAYSKMISLLQKQGAPCILDTDGEALRHGVLAKPFMIKPNEYEMVRLVGCSLKTVSDYLAAAKSVVKKGVRIVVVSLGAKGALFVTAGESFHVLGLNVPVKSKVGAGDSLIGGFVLALSRKKSLREAAALGLAASASAVMREAPRLCLKSDVPGLLRRIRIKSL